MLNRSLASNYILLEKRQPKRNSKKTPISALRLRRRWASVTNLKSLSARVRRAVEACEISCGERIRRVLHGVKTIGKANTSSEACCKVWIYLRAEVRYSKA